MKRTQVLLLLGSIIALSSCQKAAQSSWDIFSESQFSQWKEAELPESGGIQKHDDGFTLRAGEPMTGIVYKGWETQGLPVSNYRIEYEAMRVSGGDFFGTATFPVGEIKQCVSFVLGGWGGFQVGISSVDGQDASQNTTGSSQPLENGKWYKIRIEVRDGLLQVWMNDRPLVRLNTAGRQLHLRTGDIDKCAPFGFASYGTEGRIRSCVISRIQ